MDSSTRERVDTDSSVKRLFIRSSFETDTERAERAEKAEGGGRRAEGGGSFATPVLAHTCLNLFKINFYL